MQFLLPKRANGIASLYLSSSGRRFRILPLWSDAHMEINRVEVEKVQLAANDVALVQLAELELALVGGGIGETIL
jgi:hypothetical protein